MFSNNSKTILVTGGAGFIGSELIRYILKNTDYNVVNIDKLTYSGNLKSLESIEKMPRYQFEKIDICDSRGVNKIFEKYKPDCLMHLAAESHVDKSILSAEDFIKTNILGTYVLLDESLKYYNSLGGTKQKNFRFQHISTDEVFGDLEIDGTFFSESSPYAPSSPYSASKASSDHLVRAWNRTYKLPTLITNCSNNYGPFQNAEKLIPNTIIKALNNQKIPIYGDGKQIRDWLFVTDHAEALLTTLENGIIGETYMVGGGCEKANIEVVDTICLCIDKLNGSNSKSTLRLKEFVADRPGHDLRYAVDYSKITKCLGWKPSTKFEDGINTTVRWYFDNTEWSKN